MKNPIVVGAPAEDFVSKEDEGLFAFISALQTSVKTTVAAEQERGLSLAEIVIRVREIVRVAGVEEEYRRPFPSRALRAVSRQALSWVIETYRPPILPDGYVAPPAPSARKPFDLRPPGDRSLVPGDRRLALSPNNRDLP